VELYLHSPIRLRGVSLNTGTTLPLPLPFPLQFTLRKPGRSAGTLENCNIKSLKSCEQLNVVILGTYEHFDFVRVPFLFKDLFVYKSPPPKK